MSQENIGPIDPYVFDGGDLAAQLPASEGAIHSSHHGAVRPAYAVTGMIWVKSVRATLAEIHYFDGSHDVLLFAINPKTGLGTIPPARLSGTYPITASNADKVGGLDASKFLRSDIAATIASDLTVQGNLFVGPNARGNSRLKFRDRTGDTLRDIFWDDSASDWRIEAADGVNGKLWHEGNDGAESGLDADQLDGQHGSYYRDAGNLNAGTVEAARLPIASKAEAEAGTDNAKLITALRMAEAIAARSGFPRLTAGDAIRSRNDGPSPTHANSYVALHSFAFLQLGTIRVRFEMKASRSNSLYPSRGRIVRRRSGTSTVIGDWSRTSTSYASYSADVAVLPGDSVSIQCRGYSSTRTVGGGGRDNDPPRTVTAIQNETSIRNMRLSTGGQNLWPGSAAHLEGNTYD